VTVTSANFTIDAHNTSRTNLVITPDGEIEVVPVYLIKTNVNGAHHEGWPFCVKAGVRVPATGPGDAWSFYWKLHKKGSPPSSDSPYIVKLTGEKTPKESYDSHVNRYQIGVHVLYNSDDYPVFAGCGDSSTPCSVADVERID